MVQLSPKDVVDSYPYRCGPYISFSWSFFLLIKCDYCLMFHHLLILPAGVCFFYRTDEGKSCFRPSKLPVKSGPFLFEEVHKDAIPSLKQGYL